MAGRRKNPAQTEATRTAFLEKSCELFAARDIESVSMAEIARACGYGTITLYRYYSAKPKLVVAAAAWKWERFAGEIWAGWERDGYDDTKSAAVHFALYLDFFLELYRRHADFLRFNQFFNVYVRSERVDAETLRPLREMIGRMKDRFHRTVYAKAERDRTVRTDEPEEKMFGKTLHLMLSAVTRYAVGLLYTESGFDAMEELEFLKKAILKEYLTG